MQKQSQEVVLRMKLYSGQFFHELGLSPLIIAKEHTSISIICKAKGRRCSLRRRKRMIMLY